MRRRGMGRGRRTEEGGRMRRREGSWPVDIITVGVGARLKKAEN